MNIAAYLRRQKQQLTEESKHVRDFSVFDFNYIPDQPVMRDEAQELIDEILRFELSGIPTHHAIIGSRGSGKTLLLKYLQRVMPTQTELDFLYVNCRTHNTTYKILAKFLSGGTAGGSRGDLFERFCVEHPRKTVVVLDEVDLMSPKDRRREILYMLSRSEQPYMVVMLSNNPQILNQLDDATRSSLQPNPMHFRDYGADQIARILQDRARKGLCEWDEAHLAEIAALTTRLTNADARVAIKTLKYTVTRKAEDIRANFERARRDIVIDMVNDLSDTNLLILQAAATARSDLAKDVYRHYCQLSTRQQEKPFSYVYFYANLSYLQSAGLVALASTKVGRTYTNRIILNCDTSLIDSLYRLRFQ